MAGDITHDHLNAVADRLEASYRREFDQLRSEMSNDFKGVHARVGELRDQVGELRDQFIIQNGRVTKLEVKGGEIDRSLRMARLRAPGGLSRGRRNTTFLAGVVATVVSMAGAIAWLVETLKDYVPQIVKAVTHKP